MNECLHESQNEVLGNKTKDSKTNASIKNEKSDVIKTKNDGDFRDEWLRIDKNPACNPMTVYELYEEILFIILSNCNEKYGDDDSKALVEYLQQVFEVSKSKHLEQLRNIQTKNAPQKILRIEVDRAENLSSMDSNGLSDPFVTLYIDSNSTNRYNTAVVPSTLNPSWKEQFLIPIQQNPITEVLIVEVWDFDAAESVGEKMNKFVEVKGIRGFKQLLKEIAVAASTGKHDNELIGRIEIQLKSIPATGLKSWYKLRQSSNNKNRGSILLNLYFSTEKNKVTAINEHLNLLRIFLFYELKCMTTIPQKWCGKFNTKADTIITMHCLQSNLSEIDCALCQWDVYTKVHNTHFFSLRLFNSLILKLMPKMYGRADNDEKFYTHRFWEGYKRILPSCYAIIRSIRSEKFEETYGIENLSAALEIIKKAEPAAVPGDIDLFPLHDYGWLGKTNENRKLNANTVLKEAIQFSGLQFLKKLYENMSCTTESAIQGLIIAMRSIISDLQTAVELHDKLFYLNSSIKYASLLYSLYQEEVEKNFLPIIFEACNNLRQLNILDEELITVSNENVFKNGTLLFDLYLGFRRFSNLGSALLSPAENLGNNKFYASFYPAVPNWLNISVIKTLTRIEKAIELDEFLPYNNTMKYTSSALDTLSLFYQIKYFWEQLDWNNIEESYLFVEKVVNDVCRCCAFYANKLAVRIGKLNERDNNNQNYQGLKEYCYAINDINYIKESLPIFLKELQIDDILKKLAEVRSSMEAERCSTTINNIICNTVDIVDNKVFELIALMARIFIPMIQMIFEEGSAVSYNNSDCLDNFLKCLSTNIEILRTELQADSINKLSRIVCKEISILIPDVIRRESNNYRQPSFFKNLHNLLSLITQILCCETETNIADGLNEVYTDLNLYAMETNNVIHHYYEDRLKIQNANTKNELGQLTIKATVLKDSLHIHILNAYKLLPMDSENSCNSYVKVNFSPAEDFVAVQSLRTAVQHKTRCPLYDEKFFIKLSTERRQNKSIVLVFCVKNKDLFGLSNNYIGECYLSFADIENVTNRQFRISLSKPTYTDTKVVNILSSRTGDKLAKEFLRKLRQKSLSNNKTIFNL